MSQRSIDRKYNRLGITDQDVAASKPRAQCSSHGGRAIHDSRGWRRRTPPHARSGARHPAPLAWHTRAARSHRVAGGSEVCRATIREGSRLGSLGVSKSRTSGTAAQRAADIEILVVLEESLARILRLDQKLVNPSLNVATRGPSP